MFSEWRHKPSLLALISRKQRKMIITKSRLMNIAILGAIFGQTKKTAPPPRRARAAFPSPWRALKKSPFLKTKTEKGCDL